MYLYVHQHTPRRVAERVFMLLYTLLALSLMAAYVVAVVTYANQLRWTYITTPSTEGTAASRDATAQLVQLHPEVLRAIAGCHERVPIAFGAQHVAVSFTGNADGADNLVVFLLLATQQLTSLYTLIGCTICLSWANKIWFLANIRIIRWRGVVLRISAVGVCIEMMCSFAVFFLTGYTYPFTASLHTYIQSCATSAQMYVHTALAQTFLLVLNILLAINMGTYMVAAAAYGYDGSSSAYAAYYKRKYDYIGGVLGYPNNKKLKERNDALQHVLEIVTREEEDDDAAARKSRGAQQPSHGEEGSGSAVKATTHPPRKNLRDTEDTRVRGNHHPRSDAMVGRRGERGVVDAYYSETEENTWGLTRASDALTKNGVGGVVISRELAYGAPVVQANGSRFYELASGDGSTVLTPAFARGGTPL